MRRSGSIASTAAIATRSRSPLERSRGWRSANASRPSSSRHRVALDSGVAASATSASTVSATRKRPGSWLQVPGASLEKSRRPALGTSNPAASFASVVLPAPFGPTSATTSPRRSESDSSQTTGGPPGYANETPSRAYDVRAETRRCLGPAAGGSTHAGRQIVDDDAVAHEDHAVGELERELRPLFRDDDGAALCARELEDRARSVRIELRRRLVEQQQLGLERERRSETDALQLTARELRDRPLGEVLGADGLQGPERPRHDLRRRRSQVLQPERDLGEDAREHDLLLGLLEHRRDRSCELRRVSRSRVPGRRRRRAR